MGHEGYLTSSYRKLRDDKKALAKLYMQMEPFVSTTGDTAQAMEIREETRELHLQLKDVLAKNTAHEERIRDMEKSLRSAESFFFTVLGNMAAAKLPTLPDAEIKTLAERVAATVESAVKGP